MIQVRKECTGCMACVNSCPADAFRIVTDEYAYLMPEPDGKKCIECGLCEQVCPLERERPAPTLPVRAYCGFSESEEVVRISSSGGVFYTLAQDILDQGGIVFGCYYDPEKKEARLEDTDQLPLESLLTSKYVESSVGVGYRRIRSELDAGRQTLFCGTPCQAAGLKAFLRKDYPNLLLADFACGAVASNRYLRDYLLEMEDRYSSRLGRVLFRDKHYGWGQNCMLLEFENGKHYRKTALSDPYFFCFLRSSMQRLSCHGCLFSDAHQSDLCLSDFWKCDDFDVERNDRKGLSLILAFTEKGEERIRRISGEMHLEELDLEDASYHLQKRICPEEKLPEIFRDMDSACHEGVRKLRRRLLSPGQRARLALRQFVMDRPVLARRFPGLVGRGQIMEKKGEK